MWGAHNPLPLDSAGSTICFTLCWRYRIERYRGIGQIERGGSSKRERRRDREIYRAKSRLE
jgi:hypothetical protein